MNNLFHVPSSYNRDGFLDALKGFAIFTMVIGHAITWLYDPKEVTPPPISRIYGLMLFIPSICICCSLSLASYSLKGMG